MPVKTLVIICHPNIESSTVNQQLLTAIKPYADVLELYKLYPNFIIDVEKEQQRLINYQRIIFQHPIYWYGAPALLKEWIDKVLVRGFAYGKDNYNLQHKSLMAVVSTGAPRESYSEEGKNLYSIKDFLKPYQSLAAFCKMNYENPQVFYNAYHHTEQQLNTFIKTYIKLLTNNNTND